MIGLSWRQVSTTCSSLRGDICRVLRCIGSHPIRVRVFVQVERCRRPLQVLDQRQRQTQLSELGLDLGT
jgi:hypothetical protein